MRSRISGPGASAFRKSLDLKRQLGDEQGMLYTLEILSSIYYRQHQFDSSLVFATQALQFAQNSTNNPISSYAASTVVQH